LEPGNFSLVFLHKKDPIGRSIVPFTVI